MRNSIVKRLTFGIIGLTLFFLLFSLGMNKFFLDRFYIFQTKNILIKVCEEGEKDIKNGESMIEEMDRLERTKGIRILIVSKDLTSLIEIRKMAFNEAMMRENMNRREGPPRKTNIERIGEIIESRQNEINKGRFIFEEKPDRMLRTKLIEIFYRMDDGRYIVASKPIIALRESAGIASKFFILSGIATLLLSIIMGIMFARKFTRPIQELNIITKEMANMNFGIKHRYSDNDEIGELGKNINTLSETLYKTINELKEANEKLKAEVEHERRLEKMRKEFVSGVSHELKTPVALIQGYAEGLIYNVNDDSESRNFYCEVIMDETNKMGKMINELLNLAQIESGNSKLEIVDINLFDLVKRIDDKYKMIFEEKEIFRKLEIEEDIFVQADEVKIEQVITNYLNNAINHTKNEKRVTIKMEKRGENARIEIYNSGDPIPQEYSERIWESFYKIDQARSREYGGTGLGLSIVRAIIEEHNGEYGVENYKDGVGFWFELPLLNNDKNNN